MSPPDAETRAAIHRAREALAHAPTFSPIAYALSSVTRPDLRADLLRYARALPVGPARPWVEVRATAWDLRARTQPSWLPFVRWLDLWRCRELDAPTLRWLASLEALRDLRGLHLGECALSGDALAALGESAAFPRLSCLRVPNNFSSLSPCEPGALARLFAPAWGRALRELDLGHNELPAEALDAVARASSTRRIDTLVAPLVGVGAAGMRALLRRGSWPTLRALEFADPEAIDGSLPVLLAARQLATLTHLTLAGSALGPRHAEAIASALPRMTALAALDLSLNPLGDGVAAALARGPLPPTLRSLSLSGCDLTADGREAIERAPWRAQLDAVWL